MKVLIVEDCTERFQVLASQFPNACLTFARTAFQAIQELTNAQFDIIMLDHDLDENSTGINVAKWMAQYFDVLHKKPRIIIHSANQPGTENMAAVLRTANFEVEMISFLRMEYNAGS